MHAPNLPINYIHVHSCPIITNILSVFIMVVFDTQAELKDGGGRVSPVSPVTPSPKTPSPDLSQDLVPASDRQPVSEMSLVDSIYSENQSKATTANAFLHAHAPHTQQSHPSTPLYFQPSESPVYHTNIIR